MQLHFWMRGEMWAVEEVKKWLQTRTVLYPFKDKNKKQFYQPINLGLRESILGTYELIFPEECLEIVLTTLKKKVSHEHYNKQTKGKLKFILEAIRIFGGLEKIPKLEDIQEDINKTIRPLPMPDDAMSFVNFFLIGIKRDRKNKEMKDGTTREAL